VRRSTDSRAVQKRHTGLVARLHSVTDEPIPALFHEVEDEPDEAKARADAGEIVARPSGAELAVLELLATDLPVREIA
jgi:hypothetical protein